MESSRTDIRLRVMLIVLVSSIVLGIVSELPDDELVEYTASDVLDLVDEMYAAGENPALPVTAFTQDRAKVLEFLRYRDAKLGGVRTRHCRMAEGKYISGGRTLKLYCEIARGQSKCRENWTILVRYKRLAKAGEPDLLIYDYGGEPSPGCE